MSAVMTTKKEETPSEQKAHVYCRSCLTWNHDLIYETLCKACRTRENIPERAPPLLGSSKYDAFKEALTTHPYDRRALRKDPKDLKDAAATPQYKPMATTERAPSPSEPSKEFLNLCRICNTEFPSVVARVLCDKCDGLYQPAKNSDDRGKEEAATAADESCVTKEPATSTVPTMEEMLEMMGEPEDPPGYKISCVYEDAPMGIKWPDVYDPKTALWLDFTVRAATYYTPGRKETNTLHTPIIEGLRIAYARASRLAKDLSEMVGMDDLRETQEYHMVYTAAVYHNYIGPLAEIYPLSPPDYDPLETYNKVSATIKHSV